MQTVSVEYAQAHLIELLDGVLDGEEVVIERNNRPLARLVTELPAPPSIVLPAATSGSCTGWPVLGMYNGQGWMAPDFGEIPEGFEEHVK